MVDLPALGSLQTLEALSRRLRVGAAAAELGLTSAAVSQTVSRMERRLGVALFVRENGALETTPACRALVEAYISAAGTLSRAMLAASDGARFQVSVPLLAWTWLSAAILGLHRVCPTLSFRGRRADEPLELERADFAIAALEAPPAGWDGTALYEEQLIPVCTPEYARSARLETPAALARARLLITRRDAWLAWFADAGLVAEPQLEGPVVADPSLALQAAAQGQGVALCCTVAAAAAIARGELVAPVAVSSRSGRRIWAIWRKAADQTPAMQVLDGVLAELARLSRCDAPRWRPVAYGAEEKLAPSPEREKVARSAG